MTLAVWFQPSAIEMTGNGCCDGLGLAAVTGAGLGVKRFELARAAPHPEQDAGHLPLSQIRCMKRHPVGEAEGIDAETAAPAAPRDSV